MPFVEHTDWTYKREYVRTDGTPVRPHSQRYHKRTRFPKEIRDKALQGKTLTKADHKLLQESAGTFNDYILLNEEYEKIKQGNKQIRANEPLELSARERKQLHIELRKHFRKDLTARLFEHQTKSDFLQDLYSPEYRDSEGNPNYYVGFQHFTVRKKNGKYFTYSVDPSGELKLVDERKSQGFVTEDRAWKATVRRRYKPDKMWNKSRKRRVIKSKEKARLRTEHEKIVREINKKKVFTGFYSAGIVQTNKHVFLVPRKPFTKEIREDLKIMGWKRRGGHYAISRKRLKEYEERFVINEYVNAEKGVKPPRYNTPEERIILAKKGRPVKPQPRRKQSILRIKDKPPSKSAKTYVPRARRYYGRKSPRGRLSQVRPATWKRMEKTGNYENYHEIFVINKTNMKDEKELIKKGTGKSVFKKVKK